MTVVAAVLLTIGSGVVIASVAITLIHFVPKWVTKYKTWKFGQQKASVKRLSNGEIVICTEKGIYFHALDNTTIPVLVNKEEGERLWNMD